MLVPMSLNTILLDLDGTLLRFSQDAFLGAYLPLLKKVLAELDLEADHAIEAVWAGTKAMARNDGSRLNKARFWQVFSEHMGLAGESLARVETACDSFYSNAFNAVRSVLIPSDIPSRLVPALTAKGYCVVLATNPLFPLCAVESRLGWTGLESRDFTLVTHYANSSFCKPSPGYFQEIFTQIGRVPEQCLMAGNSPAEDMAAGLLGAATFLVTDCLENETGMDISAFRSGTLAELDAYLMSLPDISGLGA